MSLRTKFAFLLGLLGLAVVVSLAAAWWSVETVQREVRYPIRSMAGALNSLAHCKHSIQDILSSLNPGFPGTADEQRQTGRFSAPDAETMAQNLSRIASAQQAADELGAEEFALTRAGKTSLPNLVARLREIAIGLDSPAFAPTPEQRAQTVERMRELRELIERMETRIIGDTQSVLAYGGELRRRLLVILSVCFAIAGLAIALGLSLVRRWVLRPVHELRIATARFAEGDLTYRVPIPVSSLKRDELARLSAEVNQMAGTVKAVQDERVDRERLAAVGEMVRRLAHNLRNPLGGIRGLAEISRNEILSPGLNTEDIRDHQNRIIATVDRFERWLTDLLSVTRPTEVRPEWAQVRSWLSGLVEAHRAAAQTRGVALSLEMDRGPERAMFDPRHFEHAISAILSNAIDASLQRPAEGTSCVAPSVRIESVRVGSDRSGGKDGQFWEIRITDTGPGVPPDLRGKIFTPYFTTKRDGNGIGLAVALQVIKAHQGQIEVISPASQGADPTDGSVGACFVIRVPLAPDPPGAQGFTDVARIGQTGAAGGQDSRHRR